MEIVPGSFIKAMNDRNMHDGVFLLVCDNENFLLEKAKQFADHVNPLDSAQQALNMKIIVPENGAVPIERVREFAEFESKAPVNADTKTLILHRCDMLKTSASDVLLKTIEEPGADSLIILTAGDISRVPAVIKSRCMTFSEWAGGSHEDLSCWLTLKNSIRTIHDSTQLGVITDSIAGSGILAAIGSLAQCVEKETVDSEIRILFNAYALARTGPAKQAAAFLAKAYYTLFHHESAFKSFVN